MVFPVLFRFLYCCGLRISEALNLKIKDVDDVHHIHVWSIDGINNYATMHVVTDSDKPSIVKVAIKKELEEHGIIHTTIEVESKSERCYEQSCNIKINNTTNHHHHH